MAADPASATRTAAPTTPETTLQRGHHDWHSSDYVRQWVEENEARAEARRAQFDLLTDFIPHRSDAALRLLDVGAGWGPVTRHLLHRFPQAQATLLDYSETMFAQARPRLAAFGDRVRYVLGDLSQPGGAAAAVEVAGGPFDAIVSSSCIHNLRPTERVAALYRELREATAPGGCFLNLDMVGTASSLLPEVWRHARVEQARRRRLAETGVLPTYDELEAEMRAQRPARHAGHAESAASQAGQPVATTAEAERAAASDGRGGEPDARTSGGISRSLLDHLLWLHQAGFDAVECFWRQEKRALIGGYVQASPLPLGEG